MITIERIRQETGISDANLLTDGLIQSFIDEETYITEQEVGYSLNTTPNTETTITEIHDGESGTLIFLNSDSVTNVTEVLLDDVDITENIKFYGSGMVYYSSGFTAGVRNVSITFTQSADFNIAIESIIIWRSCIRAMITYGAAMSDGASSEKFGAHSVSFQGGKPFSGAIAEYKDRIKQQLDRIGVSSPSLEIV